MERPAASRHSERTQQLRAWHVPFRAGSTARHTVPFQAVPLLCCGARVTEAVIEPCLAAQLSLQANHAVFRHAVHRALDSSHLTSFYVCHGPGGPRSLFQVHQPLCVFQCPALSPDPFLSQHPSVPSSCHQAPNREECCSIRL